MESKMKNIDLKYVNLIIKEIIEQINLFSIQKFDLERNKLLYMASVINKTNLFLTLLQVN